MMQNIISLSKELEAQRTTSVDILQNYLSSIQSLNPKLNAFIQLSAENALQLAKESDARRQTGEPLSMWDGIPIGIKDNIALEGHLLECASKILRGYVSPYSATVVHKLQGKGMIPIGRLNMDEFAMGSSTENSSIGITKNPYDLQRTPGGSSGGSACAVAAGLMPATLGSDTGGSIRQPAAFCGIVGLKPTYGTVSRHGLVAFSSSLDQIGPLTNTVEDCSILYNIIKGFDPNDSTSLPDHLYKEKDHDKNQIRIGYPPDLLEKCSDAVKESFQRVLDFIRSEVTSKDRIIEIEMPYQKYAIPSYYITATSEASSNLARFDGIRYGNRMGSENMEKVYEESRTKGFGSEVKRRILLGTFALSSGYYDAFYAKAQKIRKLIQMAYQDIFEKVDVILLPTAPTEPFLLGEKIDDPIEMYLSDELTVSASLAGIPALSVPGFFEHLPIGIQLQGTFFSEKFLFNIARKIETAFPSKKPSLRNS